MSFDFGLVARVENALMQIGERGYRQKNVFGGRGFLCGKSTFCIVWDEGLIVKPARADYERALSEPGVTPFAPDDEKPMSTWVVVSAESLADDPALVEWVRRGLAGIRK